MIQVERGGDLLLHLDCKKSMGPDAIYPRVLKELMEVVAKPFSIIHQHSWSTREVTEDWGLASVTPIYRKVGMEDAWNYCQPDLSTWKGYGADHLKRDHKTRAGQPGDTASMGS